MKEFFELIAGEDTGKAKMAAYALYMLNKEDPEMAVSMIMAPGKEELMGVLIDLGSREPEIWQEVKKILETQDDRRKPTAMQETAQKIIGGIGDSASAKGGAKDSASVELAGWCYLGDFKKGSDVRIKLKPGVLLPEKGESYELTRDTNIRSEPPKPPNYKLKGVIGVAVNGDTVKINDLEIDRKKRVWAKVSVTSQ
jgi:hypothetical protein